MAKSKRKPTRAVANLAAQSIARGTASEPDKLIPAKKIRQLCGDVCPMTFWRWRNDPEMACPPLKEINGRLYGYERPWLAWRDQPQKALASQPGA